MPTIRCAALAALLLSACEGRVSLSITDAPADDAVRVVVRVLAVDFNREDGGNERVNLDPARDITLTDLQGGNSQLLVDGHDLPAGRYTGVQLILDADSQQLDSYVELEDGREISLVLAAGSSLRATRAFEVNDDESLDLTVDFDLRRSLTATENAAGDRLLRPALRLVRDADSGAVTGRVAESLLRAESCDNGDLNDVGNVVYAFSGSGVTPDDIDGIAPDPVSTARVQAEASGGDPVYTLAFLEAGNYTLALSCQGRLDTPQTNESILFAATANVTITAGATTTRDF